jgi:hypothetical protein
MRRIAGAVAVTAALACIDGGSGPGDALCPALPGLDGVCFGVTFDSLKTVRPGAFRDSDGVREVRSDSTELVYYFSDSSDLTASRLIGVRLDVPWPEPSESSREALESRLRVGAISTDSGIVRMHAPWTRDSVDVAATRWHRDGLEVVLRWDSLNPQLRSRRVSIWAYVSESPPAVRGRWLD